MSKVIEISDSDDETEEVTSSVKDSESSQNGTGNLPTNGLSSSTAKEKSDVIPTPGASAPQLVISDVASLNTTSLLTIVSIQGGADTTNVATTSSTTSPSSTKIAQPSKRNRRKSMHHPLCVSPEIEFETIALEDDDEENTAAKEKIKTHTNNEVVQQQNKSPKSHKTASNNQNTKSQPATNEKQCKEACSELLKSEETTALLRQIAEDRVRVNFLLASYNMPEIQFSVHTKLEVLETQLNERMKRRKWQQQKNRKRFYKHTPRADT